jgi:hypothetical protein
MSMLPLDSDRKILTSPVLNGATLDGDTIRTPGGAPMFERYSVDSLDDDEEGDVVDAWVEDLDAAQDAEEPTPEAYLSYMGRVSPDTPNTNIPNSNAARAAYEAWCTTPAGGNVPQSEVDDRAGYSASEFKGWVCYVCELHGYTLTSGHQTLRDVYLASQYYVGEAMAEPLVLGGATHL